MPALAPVCFLALVLSVGLAAKTGTKTRAPSMAPTQAKAPPSSSNIDKVEEEIEVFVDEEDLEPLTLATIDEFSNSTTCADLGYPDISAYMYAFPVESKYGSSGGDMFLPVLSTHNLEKKNRDVKKIILAVHGKEGDADTYFCLGACILFFHHFALSPSPGLTFHSLLSAPPPSSLFHAAKYAADQYSLRHGKGKDEIGETLSSSYSQHLSSFLPPVSPPALPKNKT